MTTRGGARDARFPGLIYYPPFEGVYTNGGELSLMNGYEP
jgi:hypothetical protein